MAESSPAPRPLYCPNKVGRIALLSLEEILGHTGLNAVLNRAGLRHHTTNLPPNTLDPGFLLTDLSAMQQSLEDLYGPRGGRGLATRAGRACFKYGLREFGPLLGLSDLAFRLLPLNMKIKVGAEALATTFNRYTEEMLELEEYPEAFRVRVTRCPMCWGRHTDGPSCHLVVGVLQEALFWVSGGKNFLVEEIACAAAGDPACVIHIARQPID